MPPSSYPNEDGTGVAVPGPWDVDEATYFADYSHVSNSMLKVGRKSWKLYRDRFVTRTVQGPEPTAAMQLGTLLHAAAFTPEVYAARVMVPKMDGRTTAGKAAKAELVQYLIDNPNALLCNEEESALVTNMMECLLANKGSREILESEGICEKSIRWEQRVGAHRVPCKGKIDKYFPGGGIIVDLKTATDPSPQEFSRACVTYGYHNQAALYCDGADAAYEPDSAAKFIWVVVGNEPPHDVACYRMMAASLDLGQRQNYDTLSQLIHCQETGVWESDWTRGINDVELPKYAFYVN
jgi:hypothetical protein